MQEQIFSITDEACNIRIDRFLAEKLPDISRSYIQKLIKEQQIFVNDKPIKANYKTTLNDTIRMVIPDLTEPDIVPEDIPLDILYEDADILVVNKPKGMVVHPSCRTLFRNAGQCIDVLLQR